MGDCGGGGGGGGGGGRHLSSCDNEYNDAGLGGGDPDTGGEIGDLLPPPPPRVLGFGGGGGGFNRLLLQSLAFGASARCSSSSSSISWLVRGVSASISAVSVSRIGSKMDWRETLEVSVEILSDAIVGAELWPVSMSRLKASASRDWRPGRGPGSGAGSVRSNERRASPAACWFWKNGLAGEMLGARECWGGLGGRGSEEASGLGLKGSEEVGGSGCSGTGYLFGAICERRLRGATGGGGLRGVGLVGGGDDDDVEEEVCAAATAVNKKGTRNDPSALGERGGGG